MEPETNHRRLRQYGRGPRSKLPFEKAEHRIDWASKIKLPPQHHLWCQRFHNCLEKQLDFLNSLYLYKVKEKKQYERFSITQPTKFIH